MRSKRKPGRQREYSDQAIITMVTISMVFHLPMRQTEGFLNSLFSLLNLNITAPDHTTISRRKKKLGKVDMCCPMNCKPIHLLIDSSGLKVHVGQVRKWCWHLPGDCFTKDFYGKFPNLYSDDQILQVCFALCFGLGVTKDAGGKVGFVGRHTSWTHGADKAAASREDMEMW